METTIKENILIRKLNAGMKFGMYCGGSSCYFEDGTPVNYADLWDALRTIHNLPKAHNKTLYDLCPGTYLGVFSYKFHNPLWAKKIFSLIPRINDQNS